MTLVLDPISMVVGALGCAGCEGLLVLAVGVVVAIRRHDRGVYPPPAPRVVK